MTEQPLAVVHEVDGRKRLEFPLGKVVYEADGWIGNLRVGPKGDLLAFVDHPQPRDDGGSVAVVDLAGKKKTLSEGWDSIQGLAWSPKGDEVWFSATRTGGDRSLFAVSLSGNVRLLARVPGELTLLDVSRDGTVLLTRGNDRAGMIGLAPGETKERDLSWLDWSRPRQSFARRKPNSFPGSRRRRRTKICRLHPQDRRLAGDSPRRRQRHRALARRKMGIGPAEPDASSLCPSAHRSRRDEARQR